MDAAGIASVDTDKGDFVYQKMPVPGFMLARDRYTQQLCRQANNPKVITLAHTRSVTAGGDGLSNAHPFVIDDVDNMRSMIGVHNGTLMNWQSKPNAKDYTVDSEWALNHIFDNGKKAFEDFNGSFVFAWWDNYEQNVLNFALNHERPMHIGFTDEGMAFASEPGMLRWLFQRSNIELKDDTVLTLVPWNHYRFNVNDLRAYTKEELPRPKSTYVPQSSAPSRQGWTSGASSVRMVGNTTVDKVTKVLQLIGKLPASQPDVKKETTVIGTPPDTTTPTTTKVSKPTTTPKEIQAAKDMDVMNKPAVFEVSWFDDQTTDILGKVVCNNIRFDGLIRNGKNVVMSAKAKWNVRVIGVKDDGLRLVAVCGHPESVIVDTNTVH